MPVEFKGGLWIYGYVDEAAPRKGIGVRLSRSSVMIDSASGTVDLKNGVAYEIEVGFVNLFNGNTVYTFVKINGELVVWELVEAYGKTAGNATLVSTRDGDSFTIV